MFQTTVQSEGDEASKNGHNNTAASALFLVADEWHKVNNLSHHCDILCSWHHPKIFSNALKRCLCSRMICWAHQIGSRFKSEQGPKKRDQKGPRMEMTIILVLLLGLLGCRGLPEVEISSGKRLYKGYQVQATKGNTDLMFKNVLEVTCMIEHSIYRC